MSRSLSSFSCAVVVLSLAGGAAGQDGAGGAEENAAARSEARASKPSRAGREGDRHLKAGRAIEAAKAYERAFVDTKDASYLKKAAEAYVASGPEARKDARIALQLYVQNAPTDEERSEAERRIAELDALDAPAAIPAEPEPEPEPVKPPEPPPPAEPPAATPVERVGGLRWSPSLGFVEDDAGTASPMKDDASSGAVSVPGMTEIGFSGAGLFMGLSSMTLNPINDGVTDDATAMNVLELSGLLRAEFRTSTSFIAPWFEIGGAWADGSKEGTESASSGVTMNVSALRAHGRLGIDAQPAAFIGAGPFVGYRLDAYTANTETSSSSSDNGMETDSGLVYGLHARFRTKETVTSPPLFFVDPALTWRKGELVSGTYASLDLGFRLGSLVLGGFFERRMSASGSFGAGDVPNLSLGFAKSMPVEQRIGIVLGTMWDGRG